MTRTLWLSAVLLCSSACGGRREPAPDAGVVVPSDAGVDGGFDVAAGLAAATLVATTDTRCLALNDFVWEVGDRTGRLGGGRQGTTYTTSTTMEIASATKWLFGAYVVERFKHDLGAIDLRAMTMRSGYVSLSYTACTLLNTSTVEKCFTTLNNDQHTVTGDGVFHYNGGHFQKYAIDLGLGGKTNQTLADEFTRVLGAELPIAFDTPQLAAGAVMSVDGYALFLRKVMTGGLAIHTALGLEATCTLPASCPTASLSPAPYALHYSYGHWVEDEPITGDGAFSSAGAYGFYPWIDSTQSYYGIVARRVLGASAYIESADCGRAIRFAFFAGARR
jgi:hypothetical protein